MKRLVPSAHTPVHVSLLEDTPTYGTRLGNLWAIPGRLRPTSETLWRPGGNSELPQGPLQVPIGFLEV